MQKNKRLGIEFLERREVFTGMPGVEGFDRCAVLGPDRPIQVNRDTDFSGPFGNACVNLDLPEVYCD